jgi:hypothetical protein
LELTFWFLNGRIQRGQIFCWQICRIRTHDLDPGATGLLSLSIHHSNASVLILLKNPPFILERGS